MQVSRRVFLGGAAAAGLAACAHRAAPVLSPEATMLADLGNYMQVHRDAIGIPGMTLAVATREGYTAVLHSGFANLEAGIPVGPEHLFQIGSISKMFTALTAWSLIEEGKLSPETRLLDALDGVTVEGGEGITLQHLLNHTSGLPGDAPVFPEGGLWTGFAPGSNWSYSNTGYDLAGRMIASADGRAYPEALQARVLDRLGLQKTTSAIRTPDRPRHAQGYEPLFSDRVLPKPFPVSPAPWIDSDSPAGCISATSGDMALFLQFLMGLAEGKGGGVLSDEGAQRFLADPAEGWGSGDHYGNGIARASVDGRSYLHHTGGMVSFSSSLHVDPEAGVAAFASANVHYGFGYRPVRVTLRACELLRALKAAAAAAPAKPPMDPVDAPEQYAGQFTAETGDSFEITVAGGALRLVRPGRGSTLQPAGGKFATDDPEYSATGIVVDVEDGRAVRAWVGAREFLADPSAGYMPPAPDALRRLAGRYVDDDRWGGPLTIYARAGKLWLENTDALVPQADGTWRFDDPASPERLRFEGDINGVPQEFSFSGNSFMRRDI
jgi:CubicO group peptidase (beta-lactamase class C family)